MRRRRGEKKKKGKERGSKVSSPLFPANFFSTGPASHRRRCSLTSSPFALHRRPLTTKLTDIRRTRGSLRFMANCFIIFDIFPVYGCGRAFCLGHCLLCVMNATLCVVLPLLFARSFARDARPETQPAYPTTDTRTDFY